MTPGGDLPGRIGAYPWGRACPGVGGGRRVPFWNANARGLAVDPAPLSRFRSSKVFPILGRTNGNAKEPLILTSVLQHCWYNVVDHPFSYQSTWLRKRVDAVKAVARKDPRNLMRLSNSGRSFQHVTTFDAWGDLLQNAVVTHLWPKQVSKACEDGVSSG